MPTDWEWFAGVVGDESYALAGGCKTREEAIADGLREAALGDEIEIVEARSSTDMRYEGADVVPFVRTRNHEVIGRKGPSGLVTTCSW